MPAQPNQSLADGIALLQRLCDHGQGIGSRELARQMDWEPTRANRLLGTLRDLGLAEQDGGRRYRPGPGIHLLAAQCLNGSGLLAAALPVLRKLRSRYGVALGVLWQGRVCYLLHAARGRPIEEGLRRTGTLPAEHSSIGMALEACSSGPWRTAASEIAAIRRRGFAIQRNVHATTGSVAIAIPGAMPEAPPVAAIAGMTDYALHPPEEVATALRPAAIAIADSLRGNG